MTFMNFLLLFSQHSLSPSLPTGDPLPGHLHAGGDRHEDRPDGGAGAGEYPVLALLLPCVTVLLPIGSRREEAFAGVL